MFENTKFTYKNSILDYINEYEFHNWKYRGRFLDTNDIIMELEISDYHFDTDTNMERLITYIEFIINMLYLIKDYSFDDYYLKTINMLKENINNLLEDLNYEIYISKDEQLIIIEKDNIVSAIAEVIPEISNDVIEYRRVILKGNIEAKQAILKKLSNKVEPLKNKFKNTEYKNMIEDVNFLLNNLNIRHNNLEGNKRQEYTVNMSYEDLEKWYDRTYDAILGLIIIDRYVDLKDDLKELRTHYKSC